MLTITLRKWFSLLVNVFTRDKPVNIESEQPKEGTLFQFGENEFRTLLNQIESNYKLLKPTHLPYNQLRFSQVQVIKRNIEQYAMYLDVLNEVLLTQKTIRSNDLDHENITMALDQFFIDQKDNYLDTYFSLIQLRKSVLAFVKTCQSNLFSQDELFNNRQRLILKPVLENVLELSKSLKNESLNG